MVQGPQGDETPEERTLARAGTMLNQPRKPTPLSRRFQRVQRLAPDALRIIEETDDPDVLAKMQSVVEARKRELEKGPRGKATRKRHGKE
jgi:hypothetical protein